MSGNVSMLPSRQQSLSLLGKLGNTEGGTLYKTMRKSLLTYHGKGNEIFRIRTYRFMYHDYDKQGISLVTEF